MKKLMKFFMAIMMITVLATMPVFGSVIDGAQAETVILSTGEKAVVRLYDPRGNWVADGILEISNPRNGKIGIYMTTLCHTSVDKIEMDIAVDQKALNSNTWTQVDYLSYTFTPQNNKPLTEATVDIELGGHESNRVYSLRGWHMVYKGNNYEDLESQTDGLTITG